ncbi:M43 family zinc metalloprotease [Salibacteraceae bacterium]|nr:M43 family zinc metalloprotease [Salibacteraceae bacterium]
MRYGLFYFAFSLFFSFSFSDAKTQQGNEEQCASHTLHEKLLETDPTYAKQHIRNENEIQDLVQAMQASAGNGSQAQVFGDTLEIPVVVHVIHTGQNVGVGANISTAQINGAIEAINDRYRKTPNTHGDAAGVDTEIQFVLAKRDPDCNATTGIVRINGSSVTDYSSEGITAGQGSGADELEVKALSRWPATDYVNVWVVTEIENNNGGFGIQGYAYFPGASPVRDGIIIMHSAFGVSGTVNSWNNLNRTFTHEVGHYLNLYHTFEGDNSGNNCPGTTNGCGSGSGDCCTDTEPHIRAASNCPTGTNSCTSASWAYVQHNYMNYSSQTCADMFSEDQSDRMRAALFGPRSSLLTSLGTEAPSSNTVASASCSPNTTNLSNGFGMGITNVTFENIDVNSSSAVGDSGYRDYTCHQMAEVFPSTTYSISINSGTANDEDVRVYIDFNDDGDFLDANEFVFTNDTDTLHTGNIVIPSNPTLNTPLRMRVISDWQGNTAAMNSGESCYAPQYGQVEDYALLVKGSMTASITGTEVSCNGGSDGTITMTVSSGTANYDYSWSNGASTSNSSSNSNTVTGLAAGTYTVTVTDANSNTVAASYIIGEPSSPVSASITIDQMVSCFNGNDGQMTASGSGGSGVFSFSWMNGSTSATINGLTAGTYTVTVTDANGCTDSAQVIIGTSGTGSSTTDSLSICNGDSVMVHGFMIGETGTYIDTITISGGCDSISTVIVTEGVGSYAFVIDWIYDGDSILLGGMFQTTSDIYLDTFPNNEGCDSIIETLLWVYPVQNGTDTLTICQGDSALLGNVYRTTAGVYADTSILAGTAVINSTTLFINVPQISSSNMNLNTGDSAFLAGSWRFVSGTYCDTIGACDSVNCVTLTIAPVTYVTFIDTVEICFGDSAFAGGTYQYNTGIYSDTVGNNSGVDSIFTTDLFVDPFNAINLIYSSGLYLKSNQLNPPFQWFDCDSQTVIATTQVGYYLPGYSGNFSSINQASVCGDTSSCVFHSNTANKTSFVVNGYPTSARDQYTIVFDKSQNEISIDLFNIQGQLIQTWEESEVSQVTLPLGNVASGYYMVRIATLEGQQTLKFAKIID